MAGPGNAGPTTKPTAPTPFFKSMRWRMTLWYAGVLALFMLAFAAVVWLGALRVLYVSLAQRADAVAGEILAAVKPGLTGPFGPVSPVTLLSDPATLDSYAGPGVYIQVFNPSGYSIGKSSNLGSVDLPTSGYRPWRPPVGTGGGWGVADTGVGDVLAHWHTISDKRGPVATVYVAESLAYTRQSLEALAIFLLFGFLATLAAIAVASFLLARTAVGPINQIARAVEEIGGEDLSKRLNWHGRSDELGALAATFDEMLARLEAAFARERRFIADASHELKTPLTVINANAQMLERWAVRDEASRAEALAAIRSESATMARIINAMLTLAKSDTIDPATFEVVDLGAVVDDVATTMTPAAQAKRIGLESLCATSVFVRGEPSLLRQLVVNLTENAIKFTESGKVMLLLRRRDGKAQLEVRDSGPGIPAEALGQIFERFYRADPARSRHVEGTGLGLAVVNNVVRAHGGSISVSSSVGAGTTFHVELPAVDAEETAAAS